MPLIRPLASVADMFLAVTDRYRDSDRPAFLRKVGDEYRATTYRSFYDQVEGLGLGLRDLGLEKGDRIGILSENRLEWVVADFACACTGLVDVPIFPTLTAEQARYIFADAEARAVICSNNFQYRKLVSVIENLPDLEFLILMQADAAEGESVPERVRVLTIDSLIERGRKIAESNPEEFARMASSVKPDDLLTFIYTSGTTGQPKGVMLTHNNLTSNVTGASDVVLIDDTDVILSYLPLCHSYERAGGYYTGFACGATIAFAASIDTVAENLLEIRPTFMTSVPRLFERIKSRVEKAMEKESARKQKIFHWAIRTGIKHYRKEQKRGAGPILKAKNALADKLVFSKIRERTGGRIRFFVSGGAALPRDVGEFFFAIGLKIIEGYGLTETSPILAANPYDHPKLGTVGKPLRNVELKIADDGEILARGPNVMKGYFKDEAATRETIDDAGWLHTGDIGRFDEEGYLQITDRKKHIFVSGGGKNIAPMPIEAHLSGSPFIDQIALIGDGLPYLSALIVPDFNAARNALRGEGREIGNPDSAEVRESMVDDDRLLLLIEQELRTLQKDHAAYERVRKFELLPEPFTVENGLMTPTLKVKRKVISERYADLIEKMYP